MSPIGDRNVVKQPRKEPNEEDKAGGHTRADPLTAP